MTSEPRSTPFTHIALPRQPELSGFAHRPLSPGPYGANFIDPRSWGNSEEATNNLTLEFTRIVIAIGVFAVGVELPKKYMYRHWRSLFFLLVPVMIWVRCVLTRHSPLGLSMIRIDSS